MAASKPTSRDDLIYGILNPRSTYSRSHFWQMSGTKSCKVVFSLMQATLSSCRVVAGNFRTYNVAGLSLVFFFVMLAMLSLLLLGVNASISVSMEPHDPSDEYLDALVAAGIATPIVVQDDKVFVVHRVEFRQITIDVRWRRSRVVGSSEVFVLDEKEAAMHIRCG